jgi:OOP family OmpA-OmpF porin
MTWSISINPVSRLVASCLLVGALAGCAQPTAVVDYSPPPATTPDRTIVTRVNFDFDSHTIRPESYGDLDLLAGALVSQRLAGYHFDVDGHTDIVGRLGYNVTLSNLRAAAVVDYLTARNVPRDSMYAQGFGNLRLLDPTNPAGATNRRVEITSIQ